jgi:hypothetical protein
MIRRAMMMSFLASLSTLCLAMPTANAGDVYTLQGLTFEQVASGTQISVEATSGVPYRLLNANDKQITLEIDSVDPNRAIATDFSRSDAIHHVTLKPLSANSLRVEIYGQKLGHPFIQFKAPNYASVKLSSPQSRAASSKTPSPKSVAATPPVNSPATSTTTDTAPASDDAEAFAMEAFQDMEAPVGAPADPTLAEAPYANTAATGQAQGDRQAFAGNELIGEAQTSGEGEENSLDSALAWFGQTLVETPLTLFYGVAALLGICLGLFSIVKIALVFQKRQTISQRIKWLLTQPQQAQIRQGGRNPFGHTPFARGFTGHSLAANANMPLQGARPASPQLLPGLNPSAQHLIAKTQAEQVYKKANTPLRSPARSVEQRQLDRQLKQTLDMKTSWGRQAAPQAQANKWRKGPGQVTPATSQNQNSPIPKFPAVRSQVEATQQASNKANTVAGQRPPVTTSSKRQEMPKQNQDVISFLRNVAERMEKDGNADLANEIKKTLR